MILVESRVYHNSSFTKMIKTDVNGCKTMRPSLVKEDETESESYSN